MKYRRLGRSGLKVSALSFGSWATFNYGVDISIAKDLMKTAYDSGVNFFDNAEVYAAGESEIIMGKVLKELSFPRDTFCVSSKVFWGGEFPTQRGLSAKHVRDACDAALRRLQVDYLDLYFCHRPDSETPIEETVRAMDQLIKAGKVLYWGTSEWSAQQITQAFQVAREYGLTPPVMEQPQYNMFEREKLESEYLPLFRDYGLGTTIWSPLASGILTGKYSSGIPSDSRASIESFAWLREKFLDEQGQKRIKLASELLNFVKKSLGVSLAEFSIAWCLKNPNVSTVILGATKPSQLKENLKAIDTLEKVTDEMINEVDALLGNKPELPPSF